ncbi:MAG TPA: RusA family crossover junction endodeoxyribonuclease [Candidatus Paceibacterota bacterium]|nr:RusA family crossover junction endodeoxyribonuclease [Candidatus Paceibacterota bacterium]
MRLTFSLPLASIPKGRPRTARAGHVYTPKRTREFETAVTKAVLQRLPEDFTLLTGYLSMSYTFYLKVPKSWPKSKREQALAKVIYPQVGDLDNRVKAVSDALNGVLFLDDKQIVKSTEQVFYAKGDAVQFTVSEIGSAYERDNTGGVGVGG